MSLRTTGKYLGIDLGSSFVKAALVDTDGKSVIRQRSDIMPEKCKSATPGAYEINALEIVEKIRDIIEDFIREYQGEIEGLLLSVQMHGFVYSVPSRPDRYVSWQDMRCLNQRKDEDGSYLEYLRTLIPERDMIENGVYLKPSMGVCNLFAMLKADFSIPENGTLYTLGSYIIYSLTGKNIAHAQSFAPLGLLDVRHKCISQKIVRRLGLQEITFPEIVWEDCKVCGVYRTKKYELKVFPDYGDMQVAVLGSDVREGDIVINTATASQIVRVSSEFIPGEYEIRPYFENQYLYTISNMPGGRNLSVLIDFMREIVLEITGTEITAAEVWKKVHSLAGQQDGGLRVDVNFYQNPYCMKGGSIQNISQNNLHIATLFSAAYQNMAESYRDYIKRLPGSLEEAGEIVCAGGVNWKTPELVWKIEEVSGKRCRLSAMKDEAVAGFLCLAAAYSQKYYKGENKS